MTMDWKCQSNGLFLRGDYGKTRVRVARVFRRVGSVHDFMEMQVQCMLQSSDILSAYTEGSNEAIVPTDTVKNTILMLAREYSTPPSPEQFAQRVGEHLTKTHAHLSVVTTDVEEPQWRRLTDSDDDASHDHAFVQGSFVNTARAVVWDAGKNAIVFGGFKNLRLLKTTQSGFEGFIQDKFTSLKPTNDRIFATEVEAKWRFYPQAKKELDYRSVNAAIRRAIVRQFAGPSRGGVYSESVQKTMYDMATAALADHVNNVAAIALTLPNLHYVPFDTTQFNVENDGSLCVPISEPSGLIKLQLGQKDWQLADIDTVNTHL